MIQIFHGEDQLGSRQAFNQVLNQAKTAEILRLDHKSIDLDQVNAFLNGNSLFPGDKILAITNFFSISKPVLEKILKLIGTSDISIVIWQDKTLNATQLKTFPQVQVKSFTKSNPLWGCLNSLQPKNSKKFFPLFHKIIGDSYDLFLYLVKAQVRKQILSQSRFYPASLKRAYMRLTELDFANKTGQLSIPAPIALERILLELMEH